MAGKRRRRAKPKARVEAVPQLLVTADSLTPSFLLQYTGCNGRLNAHLEFTFSVKKHDDFVRQKFS